MTAIQKKIPIEDLLFPHWVREGPRNTFDVWHSNPLKTPYFVASFPSHGEAIAHAKHLNALYREERDAQIAARIEAEMNAPSRLHGLKTFLARLVGT